MDTKKYRVLVIDDSVFARKIVTDILNSSPELEVIGAAVNGLEGLSKVKELRPDAVTLDVEMPILDGISTLKKIMTECPTSVVMLSSLTVEGASESIKAYRYGAADVMAKPHGTHSIGLGAQANELISKVISAAKADARKLVVSNQNQNSTPSKVEKPKYATKRRLNSPVVVIASSTGGPKALRSLVPKLSIENKVSYIIVQHLPEGFSAPMSKDLNNITALNVKETENGDSIHPGDLLFAKAGYHTVIEKYGVVTINRSPPLWGVRPSADVTMTTAADVFGQNLIGVVLTGMGRDGANGTISIKKAGGITLAEDESTCVVYGMPRSAYETGCVDKMVPLTEMADAINKIVISRS